jgi:hypothetical protein
MQASISAFGIARAEDRCLGVAGDLLSWLCTPPQAIAQLTYHGIMVVGAVIERELNLEWAKLSFPIGAWKCVFIDSVILSNSQMCSLSFEGSSVKELSANSADFKSHVFLRNGFLGVTALLEVDLDSPSFFLEIGHSSSFCGQLSLLLSFDGSRPPLRALEILSAHRDRGCEKHPHYNNNHNHRKQICR